MSDVKPEDDYEPFYYRLDYEYRDQDGASDLTDLEQEQSNLLDGLLVCDAALGKRPSKHDEDLVLLRLMVIVQDENRIMKEKKESHCLNVHLLDELPKLIEKYKQ